MIYNLQQGEVVCFPTETVYALAAHAHNKAAVDKLYSLKKRNQNKPCTVLVKDFCAIREIAYLSRQTEKLIQLLSTQSITFVLPSKHSDDTIGMRIPHHFIAQEILTAFNGSIIATSVNLANEREARCAKEIPACILQNIGCIIVNDHLVKGVPSTVIKVIDNKITILRQGCINPNCIRNVAKKLAFQVEFIAS